MRQLASARRATRGFTLVELMVVLAIGLVVSLVLMSVMSYFEGNKRSATTTNDINSSGNSAMQQIEYAVRGAGGGFTESVAQSFGCMLYAARNGNTVLPLGNTSLSTYGAFQNVLTSTNNGINGPIRLAPVIIIKNNTNSNQLVNSTQGKSDVLITMGAAASGNGSGGGAAGTYGTLTGPPTVSGTTGTLPMLNSAGFAPSDIVLLTDDASSSGRAPCMLTQISKNLAPQGVASVPLGGTFFAPSITSPAGGSLSLTSNFSVDAAPAPIRNMASTDGGLLNAVDNVPTFQLIGVAGTTTPMLYTYDLLAGNAPVPIADDVIELHALYGLDQLPTGAPDNIVDTWMDPVAGSGYTASDLLAGTEAAAAKIIQIKAIRVGLILRSPLVEKSIVAPASVTLFNHLACAQQDPICGGSYTDSFAYTRTFETSVGGELYHRYRTVEVTIPIRNAMLVCTTNC